MRDERHLLWVVVALGMLLFCLGWRATESRPVTTHVTPGPAAYSTLPMLTRAEAGPWGHVKREKRGRRSRHPGRRSDRVQGQGDEDGGDD